MPCTMRRQSLKPFFGRRWTTSSTALPAQSCEIRILNQFAKPHPVKEPLITARPKIITWYSCGPTVYDSAHIGHASSYIRLDVIRRILEKQNFRVLQVMGITDIDDKIINKAKELEIPWDHLSKKYEAEFVSELTSLNIKPPHVRARVSDFIPNIISFVSSLISSGFAYSSSDGSVYFDTGKYGRYGKFRQADEWDQSVEGETGKKCVKDFAVWKGYKPGEPFWKTPWGKGRPGWHIECSVMASHYFGEFLDLHSGGIDLIFPHHENEEAQCCAKFGHDRWVSHWLHTGHLHVKDEVKMSKSLGNTISIRQFLEESSHDLLRMLCISYPFQKPIEYSSVTHNSASTKLKRFKTFLSDCEAILSGSKYVSFSSKSELVLREKLSLARLNVDAALADNFDTSAAVSCLLEFVSDFHRLADPTFLGNVKHSTEFGLILESQALVQEFLESMGIQHLSAAPVEKVAEASVEQYVSPILTDFIQFRKSVRSYALASSESEKTVRKAKMEERKELMFACDDIRDRLNVFGVELKDHGELSSWTFKTK